LTVVEKQHEHHVSVSLDPLDDYLVIEPGDAESWTRGGLIIPAGADARCRSGIVTAIGPDAQGIELGDKVLFPVEAGYEVRIGTGTVKVVRREELIARVID
jgi:co-chaperonin GroES (HSP10)